MDHTAGTLTAPDIDCNINWEVGEDISEHLEIIPTGGEETGQYHVKVGEEG